MHRELVPLLCVLFVGLACSETMKGVPYNGSCPPEYPYQRICSKSYSLNGFGCFASYATSCCGCDNAVCYGCGTSAHCPSKLGKCKPTTMPEWAFALAIAMPIVVVLVLVVVLVCVLRLGACGRRMGSTKTVTFNIPPASPANSYHSPSPLLSASSNSQSTTSSLSQTDGNEQAEEMSSNISLSPHGKESTSHGSFDTSPLTSQPLESSYDEGAGAGAGAGYNSHHQQLEAGSDSLVSYSSHAYHHGADRPQ